MSHSVELFNKIHLHLFEGKSIAQVYLSIPEMEVKKRIEAAFSIMLEAPTTSEKQIRTFIMQEFGVGIATAFKDQQLLKAIFGNFKRASKEYHRYRANGWIDEAVEMAKTSKDHFGIIAAVRESKGVNRLDQHDPEELPFDEVAVPDWEPTNDIEILGYKRNPKIKEERKRLEKKYFGEVQDAEYVEE